MIYLDYQATTPIDPAVLDTMRPWFERFYANPHSTHQPGIEAAAAIEAARASIASTIGAEPREVVFTSGATEANNLAIKGAARFLQRHAGAGNHRLKLVTIATEHKCVLESCLSLKAEGFEVEILSVNPDGRIDFDRLGAALDNRTALVSVMAANNEIGVIQDITRIGAMARQQGILFHCDAAQGFGKIPLDVQAMSIDLLSLSGHKIYGPKGIGALYVRHRPRVRLEPLFSGGGQERGLRSGTLPTPLIVGLGAAAELAGPTMATETARLTVLRDGLLARLHAGLDGITVNGSLVHRLAGNLNLSFDQVNATDLLEAIPQLALSTGSACSAAAIVPSYVVEALGTGTASGAIRIGIGRLTTSSDLSQAADWLISAVLDLRRHRILAAQ